MFFIPENNTPKITSNAITCMKQNFSRDQMEQHFLLQDGPVEAYHHLGEDTRESEHHLIMKKEKEGKCHHIHTVSQQKKSYNMHLSERAKKNHNCMVISKTSLYVLDSQLVRIVFSSF